MPSRELLQRCAGLFVVGFPGTAVDDPLGELIDLGIAGVILFKRNIESAEQTTALIRNVKDRSGRKFIAAVDQEGGRVARLRGPPFTTLPPMRVVGDSKSMDRSEQVGRLLGLEVRSLGFDWDFAPVLDVDTNPDNPVIGDRSFGSDPAVVASLGVALARGLESVGVASCGKHFPGHGDTELDSHVALPILRHEIDRLRHVELLPFRAYAEAGLASIMTAHVIFEAIDPSIPATMSHRAIKGLLRDELGFGGLIVSDDLEMKAIADHFTVDKAAVASFQAGVDLFLVCHNASVQLKAISAIATAIDRGDIPASRLAEAEQRIQTFVDRFVQGPEVSPNHLGSDEHRRLAHALAIDRTDGLDPTERS